jgi:glycosyl transferase family 25
MLQIYIISLKQDTEKREVISEILEDFGLKFTFIDAIYGNQLSEDAISLTREKSVGTIISRGYSATPGEIGCTLSHLVAYQDILDKNIDWACILEDDVILDTRFKVFINTFQATGLNQASIYLLGGQNALSESRIVESIKNIKTVGGQKFSKTIKSEDFIYRTCCYLASSYLAEKLIALSKVNFIIADDWSYLIKNDIVKKIYLSKFVDHPSDLFKSHLQKEREVAALSKVSSDINIKTSFSLRVKGALKSRIRLPLLKAYRYVEKREPM